MSKLSFKKNIGIIRFTIWNYFISFKKIFIKKNNILSIIKFQSF